MSQSSKILTRSGITLLELVISSTMLAVVASSLGLVLRTSRTAWEMNDTEYSAHHHGQTVVLHFLRQAREAKKVLSIGASSITLEDGNGGTLTWAHQATGPTGRNGTVVVTFGASGSPQPLAYDIRNLTFTGLEADGQTPSIDPSRIRALVVSATVEIPGNSTPLQTYSSRVWIRAW